MAASRSQKDFIVFDSVSQRYEGHYALHDINFSLPKGSLTFLIGHCGAGKSTLIQLLAQLQKPCKGRIIINKLDTTALNANKTASCRRSIGIILQNPHLLTDKSVSYNVALPLMIEGYKQDLIEKRVNAAIDKVSLAMKRHAPITSLSAGERQRVGIARAIVNKPSILLADEATANLDPELSSGIIQLLHAFSQVGVTVVIATHDLHLIPSYAKRIFLMENGRLEEKIFQ